MTASPFKIDDPRATFIQHPSPPPSHHQLYLVRGVRLGEQPVQGHLLHQLLERLGARHHRGDGEVVARLGDLVFLVWGGGIEIEIEIGKRK